MFNTPAAFSKAPSARTLPTNNVWFESAKVSSYRATLNPPTLVASKYFVKSAKQTSGSPLAIEALVVNRWYTTGKPSYTVPSFIAPLIVGNKMGYADESHEPSALELTTATLLRQLS